jgi:hypothetical protein
LEKKEEKMIRTIIEFVVTIAFFGWIIAAFCSCEDKYLTVERRVVDAENNIPIYFTATAEQGQYPNTWSPTFHYHIYNIKEGVYDAYFHAYIIMNDSVVFSGVQPIEIAGKSIWGKFKAVEANFNPELITNSTPMAYVSVQYD